MRHRELKLTGCQDTALFAQAWLPERDPRAVVVVSHGLAEHGGRYPGVAARLVAGEYAVYALDHRGHGRSGGARANIDRFAYLATDLCTFAGRAQREHPGAPVFLLGHSMGGAIALASALRYKGSLKGLVLSAPALAAGAAVSPVKRLMLQLLSVLAPNTGALTLPATAISRDPAVVAEYEQDPLVHRGAIPARTIAELLQAMSGFPAAAPNLRIPVLIQHGTADTLVPLFATRPVYEVLGQPRMRTLRVYEGLFHEIYNEPERERVLADLAAWIEAHR